MKPVEVFADMNDQGWRLNHPAVEARRLVERVETAKILRQLRAACAALLPFEATDHWATAMRQKFSQHLMQKGPNDFFAKLLSAIQRRAWNQSVNAMIQGTCAAMMKRTLVRLHKEARATGWFRLIAPIHDEVVASVKVKHLHDYIRLSREIMCDHPDLFPTLPLHCTVSVGKNFEPFDAVKAPKGQIELDEAPKVDWLPREKWGKVLGRDEVDAVMTYLEGVR